MIRLVRFFTICLLAAIVAAVSMAAAAENAAAKPAIAGQRVFTCGHSFHVFVYPILAEVAKSAGLDHQSVGISRIGGSKVIQHWDVAEEKNEAKAALRAGKVDVLTLSPIWMPDEGIDNFAKLALQHNPNIRITVQEYWMPNDTYHPVYPLETKIKVDHNATKIDELRKQQSLYDKDLGDYITGINRKLGKNVLLLVPVGQAAVALREKVVAGTAPGINEQADLFRDSWGHPQPALQVLNAYCHFAVIYQRSPAGLPLPAVLVKDVKSTDKEKLNALLQQLAWDAVVQHPLSGVTK
jgi:hypothetical protein